MKLMFTPELPENISETEAAPHKIRSVSRLLESAMTQQEIDECIAALRTLANRLEKEVFGL